MRIVLEYYLIGDDDTNIPSFFIQEPSFSWLHIILSSVFCGLVESTSGKLSKMAASLPPLPESLKTLQHYLKIATEHDKRDPVVAYYCEYLFLMSICIFPIMHNNEIDLDLISSSHAR